MKIENILTESVEVARETTGPSVAVHDILHELRHYLPAQAPLKDFIHHNTLHAFQHLKFNQGLQHATAIFGYKTYLNVDEYRTLFEKGVIKDYILDRVVVREKGTDDLKLWKEKLQNNRYANEQLPRIGSLRAWWKKLYKLDLDSLVHPILFRIICSYLDQGISIWNFPISNKGLLSSVRELERNSFSSFFRTPRARKMLLDPSLSIETLLSMVVGDPALYNDYLFDQQFAHQGWSGMVCAIEDQPSSLLDKKNISLHDFVMLELLLEIDALEATRSSKWRSLSEIIPTLPQQLFAKVKPTELTEVLRLWQDAYEWSYYDEVLAAVKFGGHDISKALKKSFQAMFCIDDRECSFRTHLERKDAFCETFSTAGFFGVEFYFSPEDSKFHTKLCPAPVTPKFLIKEVGTGAQKKRSKDPHFTKQTHTLFRGWLISQTLGFWSAMKLFVTIFRPSTSPATASSFNHMDHISQLTIESSGEMDGDLQIGFTVDEMSERVFNLLKSIGLVNDFAPIVYVIGHGSSSVNNPHYAAYDCGACSGRPGSVNARVFSYMANHPAVREQLKLRGIEIPEGTQFVGGLHDTARDEVMFYDESKLSAGNLAKHTENVKTFHAALRVNAKERSRRFESISQKDSLVDIHNKIRRRTVSLFEPRPELNHATNALCIVGRRSLTRDLFLDRRSFLNSYDYQIDPEGHYLLNILKAAAPVCGGINLEYFFSRVDNQKLGAGSKLPHNVMGLFGVANGIEGDLRPGLPSQMIEVHDPVRLLIIVEHFPEIVLNTIQAHEPTYEWFKNEWVHLVAIDPVSKKLYNFKNEEFAEYQPLTGFVKTVDDVLKLTEVSKENIPVHLIE
jgi:uncharacterized protein